MRKFRGYSKELKKWVFGYLYKDKDMGYLILEDYCGFMNRVQVVTESVGQFTGCYDKHGIPIYEGDIVAWESGARTTICYAQGGFYPLVLIDNKGNVEKARVVGNDYENVELLYD